MVETKLAPQKEMYGVLHIQGGLSTDLPKALGMEIRLGIVTKEINPMTMSKTRLLIIAMPLSFATLNVWAKSPCDGVDRHLNSSEASQLSIEVGHQLNTANVEILQSFKSHDWTILYIDSHEADPAFLFYSGNPLSQRFITLWSGGARTDEEQIIHAWLKDNVKDIPNDLARCFAWHVTKDRDM